MRPNRSLGPEPASGVQRLLSGRRLGQFLLVGAAGATVDNAALVALHGHLDVLLPLAKLASAELAILVMFAANERWTFARVGGPGVDASVGRLARSHGVRLVGLAVGMAVLLGLSDLVGVWYVAANVAGLGAGFVANYCLESVVTWRVHRA